MDLTRILKKLDAAHATTNDAIDERDLARIEKKERITFPADYRAFVTKIGDGGAGPGYGLFSVEKAIEERGKGIWDLADPFVEPTCAKDNIALRAPGMLLLHHDGCAFYGGLVVSGPAHGTIWTYVEVAPGWIPLTNGALENEDGSPFEFVGNDMAAYARFYDVTLLGRNRSKRMTFIDEYERWLDGVIKPRD